MILRTTRIFNYQMIPNAGNDFIVCAPLMGPIDNVSSFGKLKFLLGKS